MRSRTQCVLKTEESSEHTLDIFIIQKSTRGRDKTHRKAVAREIGGKQGILEKDSNKSRGREGTTQNQVTRTRAMWYPRSHT